MRDAKGTVLVTGAGSGIGLATTLALLADGYHVIAWDRDTHRLDAVAEGRLSAATVDVTNRAAMDRALHGQEAGLPPLCGVVTCAAIFARVPFLQLDEATWDAHLAVNLRGTLFACQAVLPALRGRGGGSMVLLSSGIARSGSPTAAQYAVTKGGVLGLGRSLALELARDGIRVNMISPGMTDTPQPRGHSTEEAVQAKVRSIPMGRMARPEEIADAVLFLLGPDSGFMTGQDLAINGGLG